MRLLITDGFDDFFHLMRHRLNYISPLPNIILDRTIFNADRRNTRQTVDGRVCYRVTRMDHLID